MISVVERFFAVNVGSFSVRCLCPWDMDRTPGQAPSVAKSGRGFASCLAKFQV